MPRFEGWVPLLALTTKLHRKTQYRDCQDCLQRTIITSETGYKHKYPYIIQGDAIASLGARLWKNAKGPVVPSGT